MVIRILPNPDEVNRLVTEEFIHLAEKAIRQKGFFSAALSGGSTPKSLYTLLGSDRYQKQVLWPKVHLFWGDERCVPPDHPESNYHMIRKLLIGKIPIPEENIHRMPAELEDHNRAATEYEQTIRMFFRLGAEELPRFDLILLGMGEDGHTASLFPGTAVLAEKNHLVFASYIEKFGTYRLTLTVPVINQAANIIFLIFGGSKASILKDVIEGRYEPDRLPSQLIRPVNGRLFFIMDRAAAGKLRNLKGEVIGGYL